MVRTALPDKKYCWVPTLPVATALVILSPIVVGVLLLGSPLLLPFVVVILTTLVGFTGVFLGLYASTEARRSHIGNITQPIAQTILSTTSGQRMVFEAGPRPTPVSVARIILPKELMGTLTCCYLFEKALILRGHLFKPSSSWPCTIPCRRI